MRQREIEAQLRDPQSDYFLPLPDDESQEEYAEAIRQELEERGGSADLVSRREPEGRARGGVRDKAIPPPGASPR